MPNASPQGVDALDLVGAINRLTDIEAADLAQLSADDLERRLTQKQDKVSDMLRNLGGSVSDTSSLASSLGGIAMDTFDHILNELGDTAATASQLSRSHFEGVVQTVYSSPKRIPMPMLLLCEGALACILECAPCASISSACPP